MDLLNDIAVCGRAPYAEPGRAPGPTLLEKLLLDVFREVFLEETEDENDEFLVSPLFCQEQKN